MEKKKYKTEVLKYILFVVAGLFMVLFFSATTSPLYPNYKGWNSATYQVIGKGWLQGYIPYKDLYDQKGPIIFFVNMLGFLIAGNRYGVLAIQAVSAFISILFIYRILRRSFNETVSVVLSCALIFVFSCNYEFGNLCEEYANPFLIISLYLISGWIIDKSKEKP